MREDDSRCRLWAKLTKATTVTIHHLTSNINNDSDRSVDDDAERRGNVAPRVSSASALNPPSC
jgi:hypothetical protein